MMINLERKKMAEEKPKKKLGRPLLPDHLKKPKKKAKYVKGVARDFMWHYTDPKEHEMHIPFLRSRAQANFRGEPWTLTIQQFFDLWRDHWHLRGRKPDDVCMTRRDYNGIWDEENSIIVTRREQLKRQALMNIDQRRANGVFKISEREIKKYQEPRRRGQRGPDLKPRRRPGETL
jgi:hypothetical protein